MKTPLNKEIIKNLERDIVIIFIIASKHDNIYDIKMTVTKKRMGRKVKHFTRWNLTYLQKESVIRLRLKGLDLTIRI